jgi:hypothetical protein
MNGRMSDLYCRNCYQLGIFTDPHMSAEAMVEKVRVKLLELRFPRFLAILLSNRVYGLNRWKALPSSLNQAPAGVAG